MGFTKSFKTWGQSWVEVTAGSSVTEDPGAGAVDEEEAAAMTRAPASRGPWWRTRGRTSGWVRM